MKPHLYAKRNSLYQNMFCYLQQQSIVIFNYFVFFFSELNFQSTPTKCPW